MICARTRAFAATSAEIAEQLWTRYRVPVDETFYFPPCVDGDLFRPYTEEELAPTYRYLSEISGIAAAELSSSLIVFETSRMDRTKRKDLLLEAFERVAPRHAGVYLFIGGGPANEVFEALRRQLDASEALRGRAFLTRAIPDEHIGPMFSVAGIYASASEMEGFGMSVAQAAAAGTPIVSADTIPFSVYLAPDETLLFPAGSAGHMADAIERLIEDPRDRLARGERLKGIAKKLDWDEKTREFVEYLRQRGIAVAEGRPA
jgi:glycosyltransferase involved in cell wall biosynthesis